MQTETRPPTTPGDASKPLTITSKRKIEDPIEQPSPGPTISTNIPNGNSVASPNGMRDHSTISPLKKMFPLRKRFKSDLPNEENPYATHSLGPASPPPTIPAVEPMRDIEPKSPILPRPTTTTITTATTPNLPAKPPTSAFNLTVEKSTPKTPTPAQRPVTSSPSPKRLDKSPPPSQKSMKNENPESQLPPRKAKLAGYNAEESEKYREPTGPKVEAASGLDPKKTITEKRALDKKLESLTKPAQKRKLSIEHEKPKKKVGLLFPIQTLG
jgi:hypothetical protein